MTDEQQNQQNQEEEEAGQNPKTQQSILAGVHRDDWDQGSGPVHRLRCCLCWDRLWLHRQSPTWRCGFPWLKVKEKEREIGGISNLRDQWNRRIFEESERHYLQRRVFIQGSCGVVML